MKHFKGKGEGKLYIKLFEDGYELCNLKTDFSFFNCKVAFQLLNYPTFYEMQHCCILLSCIILNVKDKMIISHFYQNARDCDSDGNRLSKNGKIGCLCI